MVFSFYFRSFTHYAIGCFNWASLIVGFTNIYLIVNLFVCLPTSAETEGCRGSGFLVLGLRNKEQESHFKCGCQGCWSFRLRKESLLYYELLCFKKMDGVVKVP